MPVLEIAGPSSCSITKIAGRRTARRHGTSVYPARRERPHGRRQDLTLAANAGSQVVIAPAERRVREQRARRLHGHGSDGRDTYLHRHRLDRRHSRSRRPRARLRGPAGGDRGSSPPSPSTVTADGVSTATITVTLQDALRPPHARQELTLAQGGGHSLIVGAEPGVTDANGQIAFTATDLVTETVTYTAVDVTDGDLPVPGNAQVIFNNGSGTACGANVMPPVGMNGYTSSRRSRPASPPRTSASAASTGAVAPASRSRLPRRRRLRADFRNGERLRARERGRRGVERDKLLDHRSRARPADVRQGRPPLRDLRATTGGNPNTGVIVELDPRHGHDRAHAGIGPDVPERRSRSIR